LRLPFAWRARCRAYQASRKAGAARLAHGQTVTFEQPMTFIDGVEEKTFSVLIRRGRKMRPCVRFVRSDGRVCQIRHYRHRAFRIEGKATDAQAQDGI